MHATRISLELTESISTYVLIRNLADANHEHPQPFCSQFFTVFYDKNGNDKLDANWLGIPKEKVGFSNARMKTFGPPKFKECAFLIKEDVVIDISL